MSKALYETPISKETVWRGRIFDISRAVVELPDGQSAVRDAMEHHGGVCVLAVTADGKVPIVKQFRHGAGQVLLELPAGKLELGEDPFACAVRELREETGYSAEKWTPMGAFFPTPAISTEKIYIYKAEGLTPGAASLDDGEFLTVEEMPLGTLVNMAKSGEIIDAKTAIALLRV